MSEYRQCTATGNWVIIAPERGDRPLDFGETAHEVVVSASRHPEYSPVCPFCPGAEHQSERASYCWPDTEGAWQLRVVPNKFAAVSSAYPPERSHKEMHLKAGGYGMAEVLIESRQHNEHLALMPLSQVEQVIRAYKSRYNTMFDDGHIQCVSIFRNYGKSAGASLVHPHSQIIATLVAPPGVSEQIHYAKRAFDTFGRCVYCDVIELEQQAGVRIVEENSDFIALCPFASRSPYELQIFPKRHSAIFGDINVQEVKSFAAILQSSLRRIYEVLDNPDYNFFIRTMPKHDGGASHFHWYLLILPKIQCSAGFELGTGMYINTTRPEDCAYSLAVTSRAS
ncbi:MAG: galactose-1-phosphate uridylyltransferase [Alteromonadaceae bacterium]|nr:MAG: galactose-1-phosphate uridylyltransferase [Alteromonadaceae bacterium]